ncbi:MAG: exosortase-associated EpsI family protein [Phycisphaerales bacterium]|nr:MAG: exosortase-associated EpsI family protein [Phycisphaerales bacterium]
MLHFERHARLVFIVACVALVLSGIGFRAAVGLLNVHLTKEPVPLRQSLPTLPSRLEQWKKIGEDGVLVAEVIETLGTEDFLDRNYAVDGRAASGLISLHLAYYTGFIDTVPHVPDRCFEAGGWRKQTLPKNYDLPMDRSGWQPDPDQVHPGGERYQRVTYPNPITDKPVTVRMPIGDYQLRVTEFQRPQQPDVRLYAGYFFIANGRTTASPWDVKRLAFNQTDKFAYYIKVQFTVFGDQSFEVADFMERVSEFAPLLLPRLMRCLPDWVEVGQRQAEEQSSPTD